MLSGCSLSLDELKQIQSEQQSLQQHRSELLAERTQLRGKLIQLESELLTNQRELDKIREKTIMEVNLKKLQSNAKYNEHDKAMYNAMTKMLTRFKSKMGVEEVTAVYEKLTNEIHIKFSDYASLDPNREAKALGKLFQGKASQQKEGQAAIDYLRTFPHNESHEEGWLPYAGYTIITIASDKLDGINLGLDKLRDLSQKEMKAHHDAISYAKC